MNAYSPFGSLGELIASVYDQCDNVRRNGEVVISRLLCTAGFSLELLKFALDHSQQQDLRHAALILLKKLIHDHWDGYVNETYTIPEDEKRIIRNEILFGLFCEEQLAAVSMASARCVATIASFDVPEKWPELLPGLLSVVRNPSSTEAKIESALRCLALVTEDLSSLDLDFAVNHIIPPLHNTISGSQYSLLSKYFAMSCISNVLETMAQLIESDQDTRILGAYIRSTFLPMFGPLFSEALREPLLPLSDVSQRRTGCYAFRMSLLKLVQLLYQQMSTYLVPPSPKKKKSKSKGNGSGSASQRDPVSQMSPAASSAVSLPFLAELVDSICQLVPLYLGLIVHVPNSSAVPTAILSDRVDFEGEVYSLEIVTLQSIEVLNTLIGNFRISHFLVPYCEQVLSCAAHLIQITPDQASVWMEDPNAYVVNEDDSSAEFTVRLVCLDLVFHFLEAFDDAATSMDAVWKSIGPLLANSEDWRSREAGLAVFSALVQKDAACFGQWAARHGPGISALVREWLSADLSSGNPFIRGRALALVPCLSPFVSIHLPAAVPGILELVVFAVVSPKQPIPVRMSSCKALHALCGNADALKQFESKFGVQVPGILSALQTIAGDLESDSLQLVLESMRSMCRIIEKVNLNDADLLNLWNHHFSVLFRLLESNHEDPMTCDMIVDDVCTLLKLPNCRVVFSQQFMPTVTRSLALFNDPKFVHSCLYALEILRRFVDSADLTSPYLTTLFSELFGQLVRITTSTDQTMLLQRSLDCLRSFLRVVPISVFISSSEYITSLFGVVSHLVSGDVNESALLSLGAFLSVFVTKFSSLASYEQLTALIKIVAQRLFSTQSHSLKRTLIVFFAKLVFADPITIVSYLSSVMQEDGSSLSLFQGLLLSWTSLQSEMLARYEANVSVSALTKLFFFNSPLMDITLPQVREVESSSSRLSPMNSPSSRPKEYSIGIKTRSFAALEKARMRTEIVQVHARLVVFHALVSVFLRLTEDDLLANDEYDEDDGDFDEGETCRDEAAKAGQSPFADAAEFAHVLEDEPDDAGLGVFGLGGGMGEFDDEEEQEDDPDILADPLFQLDVRKFLASLFFGTSEYGPIPQFETLLSSIPDIERDPFIAVMQKLKRS
eukprot:ANDGO_06728.mRNA.1 Importin subunit beta-5